jgi:hypothetical protein
MVDDRRNSRSIFTVIYLIYFLTVDNELNPRARNQQSLVDFVNFDNYANQLFRKNKKALFEYRVR